jgi:hypothetical protein
MVYAFFSSSSKLNKLFKHYLMGPTGGNDGDDIVVQRVGELDFQFKKIFVRINGNIERFGKPMLELKLRQLYEVV